MVRAQRTSLLPQELLFKGYVVSDSEPIQQRINLVKIQKNGFLKPHISKLNLVREGVGHSRKLRAGRRPYAASLFTLALGLTGCFGPVPPSSAGMHDSEYLLVVDHWTESPVQNETRQLLVSPHGKTALAAASKLVLETPDGCEELKVGSFSCLAWVSELEEKLKTAGLKVELTSPKAAGATEAAASTEAAAPPEAVASPEAAAPTEGAASTDTGSTEVAASAEAATSAVPAEAEPLLLKLTVKTSLSKSTPKSREYFVSNDQGVQLAVAEASPAVKESLSRRTDEIRAGRQWLQPSERSIEYVAIQLSVFASAQADAVLLSEYSSGFVALSASKAEEELRILFGLQSFTETPEAMTPPVNDWVAVTPDSWRVKTTSNEKTGKVEPPSSGPLTSTSDELVEVLFPRKAETP